MQKLNDEQRKLVEDNHKLIYSFMQKKKLFSDDWYSILAIGLCKAALNYNNELGNKFSTYAYATMENEVRLELVKSQTQKRNSEHSVLYYNDNIRSGNTERITLLDTIHDRHIDIENDAIFITDMTNAMNKIKSDKRRFIVKLLSYGYSRKDVSQILGCSQEAIRQSLVKARREMGI